MNKPIENLGFVFPGQGSQSVGMVQSLADEFAVIRQRFESASDATGVNLWDLVSNGPEELLNQTSNTQPALLAASVSMWDVWQSCGGPQPACVAGHSFGEYYALVCAGALEFETAASLVHARGTYMQAAVPAGEGAMAAILGLELDQLQDICDAIGVDGAVCTPANLNAPGQIVIAGHATAVDKACEQAKAAGAKRAMTLAVSAPIHCELMAPAAAQLESRLNEVAIAAPEIPVIHNVDVAEHADADSIRQALVAQVTSPVRWIETIESFTARGITQLVECGPGKVLSGLVKRIDRNIKSHNLSDGDSIRAAIEALGENS